MPWVRIDEEFPDHPKVMKAGPLGIALQVAALCYCNRYLTDGFVPRSAAAKLLDFDGLGMRMWSGELAGGGEDATWQLVVEDLETAGLWERVEGGWRIHDYHEYQPSRAHVLAIREVRKDAGRKGGQARGKQVAKQPRGKPQANAEAKQEAKQEAKLKPVPVPEPPVGEGSGTGEGGPGGDRANPHPQAAASLSLVAGGASSAAATPNPDPDRCRHRNDPATCGICSPATGQPPPRAALAEVLGQRQPAEPEDTA